MVGSPSMVTRALPRPPPPTPSKLVGSERFLGLVFPASRSHSAGTCPQLQRGAFLKARPSERRKTMLCCCSGSERDQSSRGAICHPTASAGTAVGESWWGWHLSLCCSPDLGLGWNVPQVLLPGFPRKCCPCPHLSVCCAAWSMLRSAERPSICSALEHVSSSD